jgi:hypothetical protein
MELLLNDMRREEEGEERGELVVEREREREIERDRDRERER